MLALEAGGNVIRMLFFVSGERRKVGARRKNILMEEKKERGLP